MFKRHRFLLVLVGLTVAVASLGRGQETWGGVALVWSASREQYDRGSRQ